MWQPPMEYGLLLLRCVVGLPFVGHGSQKLFGWFGGGGPQGTAGFLASLGLASGFLTPLASLLIATVMLNAITTVVWPKGFFGGYEFELTLLTVAIALAPTGPGEISIDNAIGWADNSSGIAWGSLVLATAIVISLLTTTIGRARADLDEIPG